MAFLEESTWRGKVYSGGWKTAAGGDAPVTEAAAGEELGGTANLDAFTGTRWVTMRGDIAPYPF